MGGRGMEGSRGRGPREVRRGDDKEVRVREEERSLKTKQVGRRS